MSLARVFHQFPVQSLTNTSEEAQAEQATCDDFTQDHQSFAAVPLVDGGTFVSCAAQRGLVMLAFWGALIAGGIVLVRWLLGHAHASDDRGGEEPLAILRRRYAAGEIDRATYERMKEELGV